MFLAKRVHTSRSMSMSVFVASRSMSISVFLVKRVLAKRVLVKRVLACWFMSTGGLLADLFFVDLSNILYVEVTCVLHVELIWTCTVERPLLNSITDEARGSLQRALRAAESTLRGDKDPLPTLPLVYGKLLSFLEGILHLHGHEASRLLRKILLLCLKSACHCAIRKCEDEREIHLPSVLLLVVEPVSQAEVYTLLQGYGARPMF